MNPFTTTILVAREQIWRVARSKRFLLCLVLAFLPAILALIISFAPTRITGQNLATHLGWLLLLQVLLPVVSLIAGSAVIAEEVEDRTITYLFSRPIDRSGVFLGRWIALVTATLVVLLLGGAALCWAASRGAPSLREAPADWQNDIVLPLLEALALGAIAYTALFAMIGVLTRRPVILGLAYSFAIEGFFANLPGKTQSLTIQYHLRSWIAGAESSVWKSIEGFDAASFESRAAMLVVTAAIVAFTLGYGAWLVRRKEFVVSA